MWTNENRSRYDRSKLRYPSDVTDEEWALVGPLIPSAKRGGNKRTVDERLNLIAEERLLETPVVLYVGDAPERLAIRFPVMEVGGLWSADAAPHRYSLRSCDLR